MKMILTKKIIIVIITLLIILPLTMGVTWEQWTPSPTVNDLDQVRTFVNGKAMAVSRLAEQYFLFNGTGWEQISAPASSLTQGLTLEVYHWDTINNDAYFVYRNDTGAFEMTIVKFNAVTETFSSYYNDTTFYDVDTVNDAFVCIDELNGCFLLTRTGGQFIHLLVPSYAIYINLSDTSVTSGRFLLRSNENIVITEDANGDVYEWGGVDWVSRGLTDGVVGTHSYISGTQQGICLELGSDAGLNQFNITSGTYNIPQSSPTACEDMIAIAGDYQWLDSSGATKIYGNSPFTTTSTLLFTAGVTLNSIAYDSGTGLGWSVGESGYIYFYNNSIGGLGAYTLTGSVENNPVVRGTDTNICAIPSHPDGEASNVSVQIYNSTGDDLYNWDWISVPSGYQACNLIDSIAWNNFPIDNYTITMNATSRTSGWIVYADNITWYVIGSVTENVTNYNVTETKYELEGITNIKAIDDFSTDITFAIAENDTDLIIMSFDHTNMNNLQTQIYAILDDNKTAGMNTLTSIDVFDDSLYIGSNNELFIYNNSATGSVSNILFEDSISMAGRDYVWDVTSIDDSFAWICQKGYFTDEARMYNSTSNDLTTSISLDPCLSIHYTSTNDLLIIHQGTDDLLIYNQTNRTLLSTITGINYQPINILQDRISTSGNYLFIITSTNTIKKYDITDPTSPLEVSECRADRDIISLEAMNDNEVIIGATNQLKVCDFNNNETYYAIGEYYIAETLTDLESGETTFEIKKNSNNKFSVALGKSFAVYLYSKIVSEEDTNTPPIITDVDITDVTPCMDTKIRVEITATDSEDDELTYDWGCDSLTKVDMTRNFLYDSFECEYGSVGFRNIIVFVTDGYTEPVKETAIVNVQDCNATPQLFFKFYDFDTNDEVEGVYVSVDDGQSGSTDSNGNINFDMAENIDYIVTWSKDGYISEEGTFSPSDFLNRVPIKSSSGTILIIITTNSDGDLLNGSLVSVTNTLTGENKFGFTSSNGRVVLTNMFTGNKLLISGVNEEQGYTKKSTYTNLGEGQQKTITLVLEKGMVEGEFVVTGRGCADLIGGIWLCGNLTVGGVGNNCTTDDDCISGKCGFGIDNNSRECARFNYTLCDSQGLGRGQGCIIKNTTLGFFQGTTGTILTYFLFVLVFIFIIVIYVVLRKK